VSECEYKQYMRPKRHSTFSALAFFVGILIFDHLALKAHFRFVRLTYQIIIWIQISYSSACAGYTTCWPRDLHLWPFICASFRYW